MTFSEVGFPPSVGSTVSNLTGFQITASNMHIEVATFQHYAYCHWREAHFLVAQNFQILGINMHIGFDILIIMLLVLGGGQMLGVLRFVSHRNQHAHRIWHFQHVVSCHR